MLKILLAVDGSDSAARATEKLVDCVKWFREPPAIEVLTVHLPVPKLPRMGVVVTREMIEGHYRDEANEMLAKSRERLDAAGLRYNTHIVVGQPAEAIVEEGRKLGCDLIYMGTRGMGGVANLFMGSVATKVLHLATVPVILVR